MPTAPKTRSTFAQRVQRNQKKADPFYCSTPWLKLRAAKIAVNPLCEECERIGVTQIVKEVDHILPRSERPDLELEMSNLQSLCRTHHSRKTAKESGLGARTAG